MAERASARMQKHRCKECGGSSVCQCPHGRQKHRCKECGGSGICVHGREKGSCQNCKTSATDTLRKDATIANSITGKARHRDVVARMHTSADKT